MKTGLVLGKFMPLHLGHLALIDFARQRCDVLILFLCYHKNEPIPGAQRQHWLRETFEDDPGITIYSFDYDPRVHTDSSEASVENARPWAQAIRDVLPPIDIIFSSEAYGEYLGDLLKIKSVCFDAARKLLPVSATQIRTHPLAHWNFIAPPARSSFVKKIALMGSESTGKSTLTERLAVHYHTSFVPEMARDIIEHTESCTFEHLGLIAELQAGTILEKQQAANRFLFIDTEHNITRSYANFLFDRELELEDWIVEAGRCALYLFLEPDCPFVQDGTRLDEKERLRLSGSHRRQLEKAGIDSVSITGNWEERFAKCCAAVDAFFK